MRKLLSFAVLLLALFFGWQQLGANKPTADSILTMAKDGSQDVRASLNAGAAILANTSVGSSISSMLSSQLSSQLLSSLGGGQLSGETQSVVSGLLSGNWTSAINAVPEKLLPSAVKGIVSSFLADKQPTISGLDSLRVTDTNSLSKMLSLTLSAKDGSSIPLSLGLAKEGTSWALSKFGIPNIPGLEKAFALMDGASTSTHGTPTNGLDTQGEAAPVPAIEEAAKAPAYSTARVSTENPVAVPAAVTTAQIPSIYFESGAATVSSEAMVELRKIATISVNAKSVQLSGFADPSGDPTTNRELARRRVDAVRTALMELAVPESKIILGEAGVAVGNGPARLKRRVEIKIG